MTRGKGIRQDKIVRRELDYVQVLVGNKGNACVLYLH